MEVLLPEAQKQAAPEPLKDAPKSSTRERSLFSVLPSIVVGLVIAAVAGYLVSSAGAAAFSTG